MWVSGRWVFPAEKRLVVGEPPVDARYAISGMHVLSELYKHTWVGSDRRNHVESLGLWYVPMLWKEHKLRRWAMALGGSEFGSVTSTFSGPNVKKYDEHGLYRVGDSTT